MRIRNLRNLAKNPTGPGSVIYRFEKTLRELENRFPNPDRFSNKKFAEEYYIKKIDKLREANKVMRDALHVTTEALDDWSRLYASEHYDSEVVAAAQKRIYEYGTIAYIANAVTIGHRAKDYK